MSLVQGYSYSELDILLVVAVVAAAEAGILWMFAPLCDFYGNNKM